MSPLRIFSSTSVCLRTVVSCWVAGDCVLCDSVGWVPVCEGFQSSVQGAHLEVVPVFFFRVATDAFRVSCGDVDRAACVPSVVLGEEGKLFEGELESGFL